MYLIGEITHDMVRDVLTEIEEGTLDTIWLCTEGGSVESALAIYDAILDRGITVIGTGEVCSAGLIILLGGCTRLATPSTRFMSHPMQVQGSFEVPGPHLEEIKALTEIYEELLVERTGMSRELAHKMLSGTNFFNLQRAMEMGFVHGKFALVPDRSTVGSSALREAA